MTTHDLLPHCKPQVFTEMFQPLRILVAADVPPDPNAGASGTIFQTNQALRQMGHTVDEIWQPEMGRRIKHGNLHYLLELPRTYRSALRRKLASREYDVVEFNQPHAYMAAAYYRRCKNRGVFVNRSHGHEVRMEEVIEPWRKASGIQRTGGFRGMLSRCLRPLLDRHWSLMARLADGFHVSCTEDAEFLKERYGIPVDRIGVVSQGIPTSFGEAPVLPMTEERRKRMLYVGQFAFFKAPTIVAQAVSRVLELRPEMTMTWVCGRAQHAQIQELLAAGIRQRVRLSDWRPQNDLMELYDSHGIFLFPSYSEGFGKVPLEAMSRGLCVVASSTGGMRDFIENGRTGMLVPVGCVDPLVHKILLITDDAPASAKMSTAARGSAIRHTWERCAQDATGFYRALLSRIR